MPSTKIAQLIDVWYPSAQRLAVTLFILIALLLVLLVNPANGDDLTGQAQDDAKDLAPNPPSAPCPQTTGSLFQPMPDWSQNAVMPALPAVLKPMGKVVVSTTPPTPAPLAPPKDATPAAEVTVAKPAPKPAPAPSPALIAVSPFLQWIQANPQAAAAQARQQAGAYQAPPTPAPAADANGAPATTATTATPATPPPTAPYWLPPLIDTAPFGTQSGSSSAAIYDTPQR